MTHAPETQPAEPQKRAHSPLFAARPGGESKQDPIPNDGERRGLIDRLLGSSSADPGYGVAFWQERVFRLIFIGAALQGLAGYVLNSLIAFRAGHWLHIAVYTAIYAVIVALALARRPPYRFRAWTGLVIFYLIGVFSFFSFGPASSGRMWLLSFCLLTSLLCGLRAGLKAMVVNIATFLVLSGFMFTGRLDTLLQPLNAPLVWITSGLTFLFLSTVATFGIGFFVDRLEQTLEHERRLVTELEAVNARLSVENRERLRAEDWLKSSERELRALAGELEARVSARTRELETINRQLAQQIAERRLAEEETKRSHERIRGLYRRRQQAREEERRLISREVHDALGQNLTALMIDIAWLKRRCPPGATNVADKLETMAQVLDETLQRARRIAAELRPGILDALGLCPAVEWLLKDFEKRTEIRCEAVIEPDDIQVEPVRRTTAFRILQEALTNIARHAGATRVRVTLTQEAGGLSLKIVDNGVGISEEMANRADTLGLAGIREQVEEYGGETRIEGRPGAGTEITVTLPVDGAQET